MCLRIGAMCKRHRIGVKKIRIEGSTSTLINAKSTKSDSMHVRDGLHKKVMEVPVTMGHILFLARSVG